MDLLFVCLILIMLLVIACGAVAWCYAAYRKACRAMSKTEAVFEGHDRLSERVERIDERLYSLELKAAENAPQGLTEAEEREARKAAKMARQFDRLMNFKLDNYGMHGAAAMEEDGADED